MNIPAEYINAGARVSLWGNTRAASEFVHKLNCILAYRFGLSEDTNFCCDIMSHSATTTLEDNGFSIKWMDYFNCDGGYFTLESYIGDCEETKIIGTVMDRNLISTLDISSTDEEWKELIESWDEEGFYEPEDMAWSKEHLDKCNDFRLALNACSDGNYDVAMRNYAFEYLVSVFTDNLSIPKFMVCDNLATLSSVFFDDENYYSSYATYSSEEVYLYRTYRDKLPEELRKTCDAYIECFLSPFTIDDGDELAPKIYYDDETRKCYVILVYYYSCDHNDLSDDDRRFFFPEAVEFIRNKLPEIRKEYGNA